MKSKKIVSALVLALSIALSFVFFIFRSSLENAEALGLVGIFILNFISNAALFVSVPSLFAVIAGGAIFSPVLVALVSSLGSALGDMIGFVFGLSGRTLINHRLHKKLWFKIVNEYFKKHGGWAILVLSFIPNPVFDSIGIIAGAFAYSPVKFFILVFIGRIVRYYILASFGSIF